MMRTILALAAALALSGCITTGQGTATAGATFCQVAQPILWSKDDTRATKEQVDSLNRVGKKLCGWGKKKP